MVLSEIQVLRMFRVRNSKTKNYVDKLIYFQMKLKKKDDASNFEERIQMKPLLAAWYLVFISPAGTQMGK